jgi:hypothetical protein
LKEPEVPLDRAVPARSAPAGRCSQGIGVLLGRTDDAIDDRELDTAPNLLGSARSRNRRQTSPPKAASTNRSNREMAVAENGFERDAYRPVDLVVQTDY